MKKYIIRIVGILIVAGAAWYGYRFFKLLPQRQEQVATAKVRRGDVIIRAYSRGELRAVRSVTLTAPNLFSTVQVTRMAPVGALAKEKDLIVEFDDSERRAQLEETLLAVEQTDEQIKKAKADLAIRDNQDQVDLLRTRYAVRRAELEVKRNELISEIDAKKNLLTLEEQRRRLKQLESDIQSRKAQAQAELAVLNENRNKSMIDVAREKQRIAQAKLLSPMTGLVAIRQNRSGFFMFGQQQPDIREGDTLQPGMQVADVLDLSELEVVAKVGELDRANLHEGQDVLMNLDAVPEKRIHGKIKGMSGTASANVFSGDPAKKFDVIFSIDMRQLLTELGVKPSEIQRIMETSERNSKKNIPAAGGGALAAMAGGGPGGPGGMPGMPMPGDAAAQMAAGAGGPGGLGAGGAGGERGGGGRRGGGGAEGGGRQGGMSPEMREAMKKALGGRDPQSLTPEERQKIFSKLRESAGGAGGASGAGQRGGAVDGTRQPRQVPGAEGAAGAPTVGFTRPGGGERGPRGAGGGPNAMDFMRMAAARSQFSEADMNNAKLPPPPGEESQLDVLLRPGLLADVEIIVEKIPNALHIPAQAVFDKGGKQIVYVLKGKKFEARPVQIAKRSESTMVLAGGVQPDETVALADPFAKKGSKNGGEDKKSSGGGAMGAMPAGGGGDAGGGGRKGGR
jgi:hypothetical protein